MKKIFIVDDNDTNLMFAKNALDGAYITYTIPSAARIFKIAEKVTPDLILLDVDMPEMDGFEAITAIKADERLHSVPVIFLTAKHDVESEIHGLELGALDFIHRPIAPPILLKRIETHIEIDSIVKKSLQSVRKVHNATIKVIANLVESRDLVTGQHIERTQKYLEILVNEMLRTGIYADELSGWDFDIMLPSAQLHDVGKIKISDVILNKPGKLTEEEFNLIKTHCDEGERIIDKIIKENGEDKFLSYAKKFAGNHHEKWDGSGYPRGLKGEAIPLEGRIMAVADVYDALVSERPYKKPYTHDKAVEIIKNDSGTHFDPKIIEVFVNVADDFWVESVTS